MCESMAEHKSVSRMLENSYMFYKRKQNKIVEQKRQIYINLQEVAERLLTLKSQLDINDSLIMQNDSDTLCEERIDLLCVYNNIKCEQLHLTVYLQTINEIIEQNAKVLEEIEAEHDICEYNED